MDWKTYYLSNLKKYDYFKNESFNNFDIEKSKLNIKENIIKQLESLNNLESGDYFINKFPNGLLLSDSFIQSDKKIEDEKKVVVVEEPKQDMWKEIDNIISGEKITKPKQVNNTSQICIACGASNSMIEDHKTSTVVCTVCGVVSEEVLDNTPEWRQYNNDDNRGDGINRCGCSVNPFFPKSSQGTFLVGATNNRISRKQKWGCMIYKEKSLSQVCDDITATCSKYNISKLIIDDAKFLYKKISECKHKEGGSAGKQIILRGFNRKSIIAACVFKSCIKNKKPKNVKEIAKIFQMTGDKVTKGIKNLDTTIKNSDDKSFFYDQFQDNDIITDYIKDRCPSLEIYCDDIEVAVRIANNCCRMKLASDHNSESIAAGSVLMVVNYCKLNVDKKKIAKVFGTTDVTISKIYSKISPYTEVLVSDEITTHIIKKFKING